MTPLICDGCYILIFAWWKLKLSERTVLCFHHKTYGRLIKIFLNKDNDGYYWFKSMNEKGLSTIEIGPIKEENIIGKVIFSIK